MRIRVLVHLSVAVLLVALMVWRPKAEQAGYGAATFCTAMPSTGRRIAVSNGAELQAALDQAVAGDTILLAAGATFRPLTGASFVLRRRDIRGAARVTVRSADPSFDAQGARPPFTRVDKPDARLMPKILAISSSPAIRTEPGARGYRLVGLEVGVDAGVPQVSNLVELGTGQESSVDAEPSDIVIDRCYLHGSDNANVRRGVAFNGVRLAVVESYLDNFHDANGDSQAIAGWNGPGPFKIVDNVLEAASENVMFGGGDPAIPDLVPADIEIRRNLMTKRLSWRTGGVAVKNAFELKNARRVVVDGNTFEHVWPSGQDGTAIVLKSVNQDGRCAWCVTEYVTFSNNVVRDTANGLMLNAAETGADGAPQPKPANHIRVQNVLVTVGGADWKGGGKLLRIMGGVSDVAITHMTSLSNPGGILDPRDAEDRNPRLTFQFNIIERKYYGIGTGRDEGTSTLARNFAPFTYSDNILVNTSAATDQSIGDQALKGRYPEGTTVAPAWTALGIKDGISQWLTGGPYSGGDSPRPGIDSASLTRASHGPDSAACDGPPAHHEQHE